MANPAQQNRFKVMIDNLPIGSFTKCSGLKATFAVKSYEEGGQNNFVHQLPGRLSYENITLVRNVSEESLALAGWFASFQAAVKRSTGRITVMDVTRRRGRDVEPDGSLPGVVVGGRRRRVGERRAARNARDRPRGLLRHVDGGERAVRRF